MPAQSQQQQKLFGLALAVKRGEVPASEVSDEVRDIVDRMSEKDIEDFAGTSHKGLPKKVEQQIREMVREIMRERAISELELSKDDMDKLHSDGEVEVDGEKVTYEEGKKRFRQQDGIGKAKYTISYHDGKQKHKDGSDFFGIQIFKNKKDLETFRNALLKKGFVEESIEEASNPSIKMVNKFEPKEGIQIMAAKTLDGKTHFGGMVQRGKLARIIPFVPNQSKSDVQKRALQIFDELGKDESVNESASRTAMEIGGYTGLNKNAVQKFVDDNNLDIEKLYQYVKKGKLPERMNLVSAIAGRPNNPVQKKMIKMFNESINEGYSTEEKRIVMMAVRKLAKYRNVPLTYAISDLLGAGQELERDIKKGKITK